MGVHENGEPPRSAVMASVVVSKIASNITICCSVMVSNRARVTTMDLIVREVG